MTAVVGDGPPDWAPSPDHPTSPRSCVATHTTTEEPQQPMLPVGADRRRDQPPPPLCATGIRDRRDFDTTSRLGETTTAAMGRLQALVWARDALVVAGLRKAPLQREVIPGP